jgi:branched-chain amino acid transport system permease protein
MDLSQFKSRRLLIPELIILILLVLLATLPFYGSDYIVILLTAILMYVIITVSWTIFSGPTRYISLASAAFFGVGVYTMAILGKVLPLPVVIAVGALVSFVLALCMGLLTLRLRGMYFIIFTFGISELIKNFLLWYETNITNTIGRWVIRIDHDQVYYIVLAIFVVLMLTTYFIRNSRFGLALQSIGHSEEAAAHRGINVTWTKVIAFAISALFMGAVGTIMATRWAYVDPRISFNPLLSFMPVMMAIFGGLGQIYGPILGAAIFAYLEEFLITEFPYHYMLIFGAVLVIAILYLPNGLVGLIQKLWRRRRIRAPAKQQAST